MTSNLFDLPFEDDHQDAAPPAPPVRRIYSVAELTAELRTLLEQRYFDVWIEGEISNCKRWTTGHLYFTLKDSSSQIKAVMFRTALHYLRFTPEDGLRVVARGRVSVYDPKGEYQIVCEHLEPKGLGALQLAVEQLKRRLQAEGLFAAARKRPLPALPRKIGIVTSLEGAALRDILKVLHRRHPNAHVVIRPSRVQGEGAAEDIARALAAIGRIPGVDVVIVGRGGGAIEDLWAFNEEAVARAIAAVPVPVISAVGHEVDVTVADLVADVRAPTPSAAAELVVARKDEFYSRIDTMVNRALAAMRRRTSRAQGQVHQALSRSGMAGFRARVALRARDTGELAAALRQALNVQLGARARRYQATRIRLEACDVSRRLADVRSRLATGESRLDRSIRAVRHTHDLRLRTLAGRLDSLSPLAVLARGYAVCWNDDRSAVIRDAARVQDGDRVHVVISRGELTCSVTSRRVEE